MASPKNIRPVEDFGIQLPENASEEVKEAAKRLLNYDYKMSWTQPEFGDAVDADVNVLMDANETWAGVYGVFARMYAEQKPECKEILLQAVNYFSGNEQRIAFLQAAEENFYTPQQHKDNLTGNSQYTAMMRMGQLADTVIPNNGCVFSEEKTQTAAYYSWKKARTDKVIDVAGSLANMQDGLKASLGYKAF